MPTSQSKTLSPAELAKLEHAFATDPASDAYKALAEAYLGMGRYMEAMVVCKKGVKAHPQETDPRVLLARVYAEQGKDKKALEELAAALQVSPTDKVALRMSGVLQMKGGDSEAGKASLLKAWQADPNDAELLEALRQWKVEPPAAAAPAPAPAPQVPQPPAPGVQAPSAPTHATNAAQVAAPSPQVQAPPVAASPSTNGVHAQPQAQPTAPARRLQARPARPAQRPVARPVEVDDDDEVRPARRGQARQGGDRSKLVFVALVVLVPMVAAGYYFGGQYKAKKNRQIKKLLGEATEKLKNDSYDSYKKACEAAEQALELDGDSVDAHAYLAYAYAIRWGEHGGGDDARKKAEEHLAGAMEDLAKPSSHRDAASALIKTFAGKGQEALKDLDEKVKGFEAENKRSSLLSLTLGLIQMNAGDLERARDNLEKAQGLAPDDPRIYAALGNLYRRLGQDSKAWKNFDFALRYENNHPESLLGKALLMLEQDGSNYILAAEMIKKLVDGQPPPSPRQLATSHLARSFLISRVSSELSTFKADEQKKLIEATAVPADKDKARAELTRSEETGFSLDRRNPELHLIKGRRLIAEGQIDQAVEEIRAAIKLDHTRAQFHVELARALMAKRGGEKEAAESLSTAIRTMGESPKLVLMLGQAYQRSGEVEKALEQYQRAVADPKAKNPEARLAMGAILREKKDYSRSQIELEKAAQEFVGQPTRVAAANAEVGRLFDDRGERAKAEDAFQRALNADPDFTPAWYHYAKFLAGDPKTLGKARTLAQEYLKKEPRGEFAAEAARLGQ
jgi:cellulose synthase operon protein C